MDSDLLWLELRSLAYAQIRALFLRGYRRKTRKTPARTKKKTTSASTMPLKGPWLTLYEIFVGGGVLWCVVWWCGVLFYEDELFNYLNVFFR